jgi:hypothetical protein
MSSQGFRIKALGRVFGVGSGLYVVEERILSCGVT